MMSKATCSSRYRKIFRWVLSVFWIDLLLLVFLTIPADGQVRGIYSPGSTLTGGGTLPDPGVSYSNQVWYGTASELRDSEGRSVPVQGSVTVVIDNNTLVYVPKFKFLGANLEFTVDIAFSNGRYSARDPFSGAGFSGHGAGLTNTNFVPFDLGWRLKRADIQAGYSVYAPTGPYSPGSPNNVSTGFWTNAWQTGTTIYLTKSKSTQISAFNVYAWNTTQSGTGVHPGQNDSLDYSFSRTISLSKNGKWSLLVGAAGYGQWQTTENSGQTPAREALQYRVDAGGFIVNFTTPLKGFYLSSGTLWEYGARSTVQGRTMTVTGGFQF